VSSFLELVPFIFSLQGVSSFLSGKLNQDPLETFFGCIRQHGKVNDNPTVHESLKSVQALRVVNSIRFSSVTGNCRGTNRKVKALEEEEINQKLPKRKRPSRK